MEPDVRRQTIAREAKAIVTLAFRNRPIEQFRAGRACPTCAGDLPAQHIRENTLRILADPRDMWECQVESLSRRRYVPLRFDQPRSVAFGPLTLA
jgi:hypothetical protein